VCHVLYTVAFSSKL